MTNIREAQTQVKLTCACCGKPVRKISSATGWILNISANGTCRCSQIAVETPAAGSMASEPIQTRDLAVDEECLDKTGLEETLRIPGFEIGEIISSGGMGNVYKAQHKTLGKTFAIKVLRPELATNKVTVKRFEQEAIAAGALTHVNLVALYEYGVSSTGEQPYLVMDYINGPNLAQLIHSDGYLDLHRAVNIFLQIAEALEHAHRKGVVHRDLKPANVLIAQESAKEIVKLVDFGIAKILPAGGDFDGSVTETGEIFGSPLYMSPEQCQGDQLGPRSDIYSFGCLMYECITGKPPFTGRNAVKIILQQINDAPRPISQSTENQRLPGELDDLIMSCLSKNPLARPNAERIAKQLELIHNALLANCDHSERWSTSGWMLFDKQSKAPVFNCGLTKHPLRNARMLALALVLAFAGLLLFGYYIYPNQGLKRPAASKPFVTQNDQIMAGSTVDPDGIALAWFNNAINQFGKAPPPIPLAWPRSVPRPQVVQYVYPLGSSPRFARTAVWRYTPDLATADLAKKDLLMRLHYERGRLYDSKHSYKDALADFSAALAVRFDQPDIYIARARTFAELSDFDRAVQNAKEALLRSSDSPNSACFAYLCLASVENAAGAYGDAIKDCKAALRIAPDINAKISIYVEMARAYDRIGDYHSARTTIEKTGLEPDTYGVSGAAMMVRGLSYLHEHNFEKAKKDLGYPCDWALDDQPISFLPTQSDPYAYLAYCYAAEGHSELAEKAIAKASTVDSWPAHFYRRRGGMYLVSGQFDQAIDSYTLSLKLEPTCGTTYQLRGIAYLATGQLEKAASDLKQAAQNNARSTTSISYYALVSSLLQAREYEKHPYVCMSESFRGPYDGWLFSLNETFRQSTPTAIAYLNRAAIHLLACHYTKDFRPALEDCYAALKIDPNLAQAHDLLAKIYEKQANKQAAANHARRAKELGYPGIMPVED